MRKKWSDKNEKFQFFVSNIVVLIWSLWNGEAGRVGNLFAGKATLCGFTIEEFTTIN